MEIGQLEKQVEWLDNERREDKQTISFLQKRIAQLEETLDKSNDFTKELSSEVTRIGVLISKTSKFDDALSAHRKEVKKELGAQEKRAKRREGDTKKRQGQDIDDLLQTVTELSEKSSSLSKLRDEILKRKDDDDQRNRLIAELKEKVDSYGSSENERKQIFRSIEEGNIQDKKRLTDVQGEISALRKRADEQRGKFDLFTESQKKLDNRLNELLATESERREAQNAFTEKITLDQVDRDKIWKDWSKRFDAIDKQSANFAETLQNIDEAERAVKKARDDFEEITDQITRRINEITEMQRLGEERFRQEWSTFKADDQKRWTNYALTQDEQHKEMNRRLENLIDRTTTLEENTQDIQDALQHLSEQNEKLNQTFMSGLRDWLAENDRFDSSVR